MPAHFGVAGQVQVHKTCLAPQLQWSQVKNVWHNAGIRTTLYILAAPLRWVGKLFKR
jgi:hypothetical protein